MATKIEIGFGVFAAACFAGAVDAWLGTGAVDMLVDLCLSDPDAVPADMDPMPMSEGGHNTHASLFLAAGLASLGLGLSSGEIAPLLQQRRNARPEGQARRRLIAALVYVARTCRGATPRDVAEAYLAATGEEVDRREVGKAVGYLRSSRAAPIERILGKVTDDEEKRLILNAACRIWFRHGVDSEIATRTMERVTAALGLEGNDINAALDVPWSIDPAKFFKNVETIARRTVSRATTEAQRITTRIRGFG